MYNYFVSFVWENWRKNGIGNSTIETRGPITTHEEIREIERGIARNTGAKNVVLINYILLDAPKTIEVLD